MKPSTRTPGGNEPVRTSRRRRAAMSANRMSASRSQPVTWASFIRSPPDRRSTGRECGWSRGSRVASSGALYCHNPDTWNMTNGIPVTLERAKAQLRKYHQGLRAMKGGLTISGGEPLMQNKFVIKVFSAAKRWASTRRSTRMAFWAAA